MVIARTKNLVYHTKETKTSGNGTTVQTVVRSTRGYSMLKSIYDPEIPVDIYELGLIYEVKIDKENNVAIDMTLTSPNCPVAESLPKEVEDKVASVEGVTSAKVNIVFDPSWDKDMMSEEAKLELGFL
jgi:FeS assembly SUF system protein